MPIMRINISTYSYPLEVRFALCRGLDLLRRRVFGSRFGGGLRLEEGLCFDLRFGGGLCLSLGLRRRHLLGLGPGGFLHRALSRLLVGRL